MLKKNNLLLKAFLIILAFNILMPADKDAPFGDILLHHVTNDQSENFCYNSNDKKLIDSNTKELCCGNDGELCKGEESNQWLGGIYFPIKIGGLDLSITKHVILIWVVSAIVIALGILGTSRYRNHKNALPSKFSNLFEILIDFIRNNIIIPNIGKKDANRWTPLIATFFFFILTANFLGLIPFLEFLPGGSGTITGNFAVTGALALITFVSIIIAGTMKHGFIGHWKNMIPSGVPAPVLLILIPV